MSLTFAVYALHYTETGKNKRTQEKIGLLKSVKKMAIPAGLEPATYRLEVCDFSFKINDR